MCCLFSFVFCFTFFFFFLFLFLILFFFLILILVSMYTFPTTLPNTFGQQYTKISLATGRDFFFLTFRSFRFGRSKTCKLSYGRLEKQLFLWGDLENIKSFVFICIMMMIWKSTQRRGTRWVDRHNSSGITNSLVHFGCIPSTYSTNQIFILEYIYFIIIIIFSFAFRCYNIILTASYCDIRLQ